MKICLNVVTIFACEGDSSGNDSDGVLGREEQDAFFCDAPGKFFYEPGKWGTNALAWQMGDLPVICDNGASCRMSRSSTDMINYPEANATMRTEAASDTRSRGMLTSLLVFGLAVVKDLCYSATLHLYLASATIFFPSESQPITGIRTPEIRTV